MFAPTFCGIAHLCHCFPGWVFAHIPLWPSISNPGRMGRGRRHYSSLLFSLCFCFTHTVYFQAGLLLLANTSLHTGTKEQRVQIQSGRGTHARINFVHCRGFLERAGTRCVIFDGDCADIGSWVFGHHPSAASWAEVMSHRMTLAASTWTAPFSAGITVSPIMIAGWEEAAVFWR